MFSFIVLSFVFAASRMSAASMDSIRNILLKTFSYSSYFAFVISFSTQWFFPCLIISIPIRLSVICDIVSIVLHVLFVNGSGVVVLLNWISISSSPLIYAETMACQMSLVLKPVMSIVVFLVARSDVVFIMRLSFASCRSTSSPFFMPYFFTHLLGRLMTCVLPASCITFLFMAAIRFSKYINFSMLYMYKAIYKA